MKTLKNNLIFFLLFIAVIMNGQNIEIVKKDGTSIEILCSKPSIENKGIRLNSNAILNYGQITKIKTSDFDIYEKAIKKTSRDIGNHIEVVFTGDENLYLLQLEKLKVKRDRADRVDAAGGILTLIGVLSGDRRITAAGIATTGIGSIAKDINDSETLATQTAMLNDLDQRTKHTKSEEEILGEQYGTDNVKGLKFLAKKDYQRAMAYANIGELSDDWNYQLSAAWLKAMIAKDQNNKEEVNKRYQILIDIDPEIKNLNEAEKETSILIEELSKWRN